MSDFPSHSVRAKKNIIDHKLLIAFSDTGRICLVQTIQNYCGWTHRSTDKKLHRCGSDHNAHCFILSHAIHLVADLMVDGAARPIEQLHCCQEGLLVDGGRRPIKIFSKMPWTNRPRHSTSWTMIRLTRTCKGNTERSHLQQRAEATQIENGLSQNGHE